MASKIVINFRDGITITYPNAKLSRGITVKYGEGIVTIEDMHSYKVTYPLDIILSIEEEPEPRW